MYIPTHCVPLTLSKPFGQLLSPFVLPPVEKTHIYFQLLLIYRPCFYIYIYNHLIKVLLSFSFSVCFLHKKHTKKKFDSQNAGMLYEYVSMSVITATLDTKYWSDIQMNVKGSAYTPTPHTQTWDAKQCFLKQISQVFHHQSSYFLNIKFDRYELLHHISKA